MNKTEKEIFAMKIVENMDMETLLTGMRDSILDTWKRNPNILREDIKNRI